MSDKPVILVVEDQELLRDMMAQQLAKAGFDHILCADGQEALDAVSKQKIDLVLLDLYLPDKTGHEVLEAVRKDHSGIGLPVIMVTSEEDPEAVLRAFDLGANDYVTKDIPFKITLRRIRTQLEMKKLAGEAARASEMKALTAMIVTYCHQINNPLTILQGNLGGDLSKVTPEKYERALKALERIRELMINIRDLDVRNIEYSKYSEKMTMLKIG